MHALKALGLDASADERAVKRAYAQRLKAVRPDDDPQGFQQLHETYMAALTYVRSRGEDAEGLVLDESRPPVPGRHAAAEEEAPPSGSEHSEAPASIKDSALSALFLPGESPARFQFDLDAFLKDLFERAARDDGVAFRSWLAREASFWPFGVKPLIARDVLAHMIEEERYVSTTQLQAVVDVFELDDVLAGFDPLVLGKLRYRTELHERALKVRALLHPQNRWNLCRHMGHYGGYSAPVTWTIVFLLTNPRSPSWRRTLQFVPFVTRRVTDFLHHLDEGRYDALTPAIDRATLEFWVDAEVRRQNNSKLRYALVIFAAMVCFAYLVSEDKGRSELPAARYQQAQEVWRYQLERQFQDLVKKDGGLLDRDRGPEAIGLYDLIISGAKPPQDEAMSRLASAAYYNKGYKLLKSNRASEARRTYEEFERIFADSTDPYVQLRVAAGLVYLARVLSVTGQSDDANAIYARVAGRYGGSEDDRIKLQVANALFEQARILDRLGRRAEALATCGDVERRFASSTDADIMGVVAAARSLKRLLE